MRRAALLFCVLLCAGLLAPAARADLPPIKHVFLIVLENKDHDESFARGGRSEWLARTLPRQGELLRQYYALLRTIEDLFGLPHLGYVGAAGLRPFGADVFNATPAATAPPHGKKQARKHTRKHRRHHRHKRRR